MSCTPADVKVITSIVGTTVTTTYVDLRVSPPVLIDQATYDALVRVKCPENIVDWEPICVQPIDNTDAALVEQGMKCVPKRITYADTMGTIDEITIGDITLHQADGTDVTATFEEVACPEPVVVESDYCVAP